ncbi:MAG: hypothetical protein ACI841_000143 [Planctomycetota bacterium]|jgi:hypothetical protein
MKLTLLLFPMMLSGASLSLATPTVTLNQSAEVDLDELDEEYLDAVDAWRDTVRSADNVKERSRLRKLHPAREYMPRFKAAAEAGQGQAYLWILENAKDAGHKRKEVATLSVEILEALHQKHIDAPWFDDVLVYMVGARRALTHEFVQERLTHAMQKSSTSEVRIAAQYHLGMMLADSKDAEKKKRGIGLLNALMTDHPDSPQAELAINKTFKSRFLSPGGKPIDFDAEDADGVAFKLSDYRGKVVLIDFWGFW